MRDVVKVFGVAVVAAGLCPLPILANYSAPFKEAAAKAMTIAVVRCESPGSSAVRCVVERILKGVQVEGSVHVQKRAWVRYGFGALGQAFQHAKFLILLDAEGRECCFGDLPIIGDACTSMVPIVNGWLPSEFRAAYDGAPQGRLSLSAVLRDLQVVEQGTR